MNKKIVGYLAAPYSFVNKSKEIGLTKPDYSERDKELREKRFTIINQVAGKLIESGFAIISPISQSHPIALECNIGGKFDYWADIDYNIIIRCDMVFVLCIDGWKDSEGVKAEIIFAKKNNILVIYIDTELRIINA